MAILVNSNKIKKYIYTKHAPFIFFQVPYGLYYLQMNTLLGILDWRVEDEWLKRSEKLKTPCMPWYLIKYIHIVYITQGANTSIGSQTMAD
jgi:hypothetical protein